MKSIEQFAAFLEAAREDSRLTPGHISLYAALFREWIRKDFKNPIEVFSKDMRSYCKIAGNSTYHRAIKELHQWGYIHYVASYNHFLGSLVHFIPITLSLADTAAINAPVSFYFLMSDKRDYKIAIVRDSDVAAFLQRFKHRILLRAGSAAELLQQFIERQ